MKTLAISESFYGELAMGIFSIHRTMSNSVELKVEFLMLCHNGNSKEVKKVLKRGWMWPLEGRSRFYPWRRVYVQVASLVTTGNYEGNSAIHIASLSGHLGVVLVLLKHGNVDVNMANNK